MDAIFHAAFSCTQPSRSGRNYMDSNFARLSVCAQPPQKIANILSLSATAPVAAFAVYVQSASHPPVCGHTAYVLRPVRARLIANAHNAKHSCGNRRSARNSQLSTCPRSVPPTAEEAAQNRFISRRIAIMKKAMTSPVVNFVRNPSMERPLFFPQ